MLPRLLESRRAIVRPPECLRYEGEPARRQIDIEAGRHRRSEEIVVEEGRPVGRGILEPVGAGAAGRPAVRFDDRAEDGGSQRAARYAADQKEAVGKTL